MTVFHLVSFQWGRTRKCNAPYRETSNEVGVVFFHLQQTNFTTPTNFFGIFCFWSKQLYLFTNITLHENFKTIAVCI